MNIRSLSFTIGKMATVNIHIKRIPLYECYLYSIYELAASLDSKKMMINCTNIYLSVLEIMFLH